MASVLYPYWLSIHEYQQPPLKFILQAISIRGLEYMSFMDAPSAAQRKKIHEYFFSNSLLRI